MFDFILNSLKGALMGAANVIPGVSGGTMALLTGIFERLINAVKSFDLVALRLLLRFRLRELMAHLDARFLLAVGLGVLVSILSFAHLLEYLFEHQAIYVWSFFFGLILASVYFVGRKIGSFRPAVVVLFLLGAALAAGIAFMEPAEENASVPYLMLCGAVAMCSMILPGLSGSYVLLLMGNYQLVMIKAVSDFDLAILIPVGIGAAAGLAAFARLLSWIFSKYHDQTIALLTGFIFGSLILLWPWKEAVTTTFQKGDEIREKIIGYLYAFPDPALLETWIAVVLMVAGIAAPRWGFEGFLPRKGRERRERLARVAADDRATVLFEAPGRTAATLRDLAEACGPSRQAAVARELTKLHEEVRRGSLGQLAAEATTTPVRGEVVIVVAGADAAETAALGLEAGRARDDQLVAEGVKRSAAARMVAQETGLPRRELFATDD